jgi:hypothetical protein
MARDVLGNGRLLVPAEAERLQAAAALQSLLGAPCHVRVDLEIDALANELAHRRHARFVLARLGLAYLHLDARQATREEAFGLREELAERLGQIHARPVRRNLARGRAEERVEGLLLAPVRASPTARCRAPAMANEARPPRPT